MVLQQNKRRFCVCAKSNECASDQQDCLIARVSGLHRLLDKEPGTHAGQAGPVGGI